MASAQEMQELRLLQGLTSAQRTACRLLAQYPLFHYTAQPQQLDVLLIGHGAMAEQMLLDAAWCGQMPGWSLTIHTTHPNDEQARLFASALTEKAPMLPHFSNLGDAPEALYVHYDFASVPELTAQALAARFPASRWILIDLGDDTESRTLAQQLSRMLPPDCTAIILYAGEAAPDDAAGPHQLVPIDLMDEDAQRTLARLARHAADIDWFYTRQRNPFASREKQRQDFMHDAYAQRSSLHPALFCYKLASLGIDPEAPSDEIAREYARRVFDSLEGHDFLVYSEHRRWLMSQVMAGMRLPTKEQLRTECFTLDRHRFNNGRLHNCIVTSDPTRPLRLHALTRQDWDSFPDWEAIDRTELDELDKVSLKCHLLAREMLDESLACREDRLKRLQTLLTANAPLEPRRQAAFKAFRAWFIEVTNTGREYRALDQQLHTLRELLVMDDPEACLLYRQLHRDADLAYEYHRCHNYKDSDKDMVDQLPWLYCRPEKLMLIKLVSSYVLDNIAPVLLLEPDCAVYVGAADRAPLTAFFHERGGNVALRFVSDGNDFSAILNSLLDEYGANAVIDLTGAPELQVAQAVLIAQQRGTGVICTDSEQQRVTEVLNFPLAGVIRKHISLRADEVFRLYGGQARPAFTDNASVSLHELRQTVGELWTYYCQTDGRERWKVFTTAVQERLSGQHTHLLSVTQQMAHDLQDKKALRWQSMTLTLPCSRAENANLQSVLTELQAQHGLIRELTCFISGDELHCTFQYPEKLEEKFLRLAQRLAQGSAPLLSLSHNASFITITDLHNLTFSGKWPAKKADFLHTVQYLQTRQLLIDASDRRPDGTDYAYTFANASMALCTANIGSLLEAYTAMCAVDMLSIDDVRLGYTIRWRTDSDACSELDIVAISGLRIAFLSCKDTQPRHESLIEIAHLASSFSNKRRAMLITAHEFQNEGERQHFHERAAIAGVTCIDRPDLAQPRLCAHICQILGLPST